MKPIAPKRSLSYGNFLEVMKETLGVDIPLQVELEAVRDKEILSSTLPGEFKAFRELLLAKG